MRWSRGVLVGLVLVSLAAGACARDALGVAVERDRTWVLVEGSAGGEAISPPAPTSVTLIFTADGVRGVSACNHYFGELTIRGGRIEISGLGGTEMGCDPPVMAVEQAYLGALGGAEQIARVGDRLTLSGPDTRLVFELLPLVPDEELVGTTWQLDTLIEGETASSIMGEATLVLDDDGTIEGSTGCNDIGGRYELDGARIVVTDLNMTDVGCPDVARQEQIVLDVLGGQPTVRIEGSRLWLDGPQGLGLGYLAAD